MSPNRNPVSDTQPTMVNPVTRQMPSEEREKPKAPELQDDIVAIPLTLPDFANDIQRHLVNQNLWPRWIFTDRRRYAQAKAQGYRNCTRADLKAEFANLNPFEEENGTKYINGDLILMLIDRRIYLGALRRKHEAAERLATSDVQKQISKRQAQLELGDTINQINEMRQAAGQGPIMEAFDPRDENAPMEFDPTVAKAIARMGHTGKPDTGSARDLKQK